MKKSLTLLGVIALFAIAPAQLHAEEMIPKSLAIRLLKCPGDCIKNMQLLVGQIPASISGVVPLPENAKVVATLIRNSETSEVFVDSAQSPEQVRSQLRSQLTAKGWKVPPHFASHQSGFVASEEMNSEFLLFCNPKDNSELHISADRTTSESFTDVRLYLDKNSDSCATAAEIPKEMVSHYEALSMMPRLLPPSKVTVEGSRLLPGEEMVSSAKLETSLSRAELHQGYADQLDRAGWKKQSQQDQGKVTSSSWTFRDAEGKTRQGLLILTAKDAPNQFSGVVILMQP